MPVKSVAKVGLLLAGLLGASVTALAATAILTGPTTPTQERVIELEDGSIISIGDYTGTMVFDAQPNGWPLQMTTESRGIIAMDMADANSPWGVNLGSMGYYIVRDQDDHGFILIQQVTKPDWTGCKSDTVSTWGKYKGARLTGPCQPLGDNGDGTSSLMLLADWILPTE